MARWYVDGIGVLRRRGVEDPEALTLSSLTLTLTPTPTLILTLIGRADAGGLDVLAGDRIRVLGRLPIRARVRIRIRIPGCLLEQLLAIAPVVLEPRLKLRNGRLVNPWVGKI